MAKYPTDEGDNFRVLGYLEPHPKYKGVFVYAGSNIRNRSMAQILKGIQPKDNLAHDK